LIKPDDYDFQSIYNIPKYVDARDHAEFDEAKELEPENLKPALKLAVVSSIVLSVVLILIWPLPMYFSKYVYSLPFWTFWVALGLGWAFAASLVIIILPIWESREGLVALCRGIIAGKPVEMAPVEVTSAEISAEAEKGMMEVEKVGAAVVNEVVEDVKA
jgi:hypothetical protein